ncbi:CU044_2847 family protein [Streptomyces sp. NPDC079167]|uniref:CU044_2847 family protein n=1 Tax=Streptomyces sp. NPDC079167 TaxID=3154513 RepID=UPI00341E8B3A
MTETVTVDLGNGTSLVAEVVGELQFQQPDGRGGDQYGDVGRGRPTRAAQLGSAVAMSLDQVRTVVQGMGRWAADTVNDESAGSPDTAEIEFGLKLAVKSGQLLGVIAEAGSEASLTVRLSWDLASRREQVGVHQESSSSNSVQ